MKEFFLFMVLPALAPSALSALKGVRWGFILISLQLGVLVVSLLGLKLLTDPYTATAWLISSLLAVVLVSIQALVVWLYRSSRKKKELSA
jgi:hypothetical protein